MKILRKALGAYAVAEICQVTPATVGNWMAKGLFPTLKTGGGHRRVWEEDLALFLEDHNLPIPPSFSLNSRPALLVVDDEPDVRGLARRALKNMYPDAEILEAEDGFEAGQKIIQDLPSLIVLDLKMPGMDGFKVCRAVRANGRTHRVKILAISGHNLEESREKALAAGADDFLGKPFGLDELKAKVWRLIGKSGRGNR